MESSSFNIKFYDMQSLYTTRVKRKKAKRSHSFSMVDISGSILSPPFKISQSSAHDYNFFRLGESFILPTPLDYIISIALPSTINPQIKIEKPSKKSTLIKNNLETKFDSLFTHNVNLTKEELKKKVIDIIYGEAQNNMLEVFPLHNANIEAYEQFASLIKETKANDNPIIYELNVDIKRHFKTYSFN